MRQEHYGKEYDGTLFVYVGFIALIVFFISIGIYSFEVSNSTPENSHSWRSPAPG